MGPTRSTTVRLNCSATAIRWCLRSCRMVCLTRTNLSSWLSAASSCVAWMGSRGAELHCKCNRRRVTMPATLSVSDTESSDSEASLKHLCSEMALLKLNPLQVRLTDSLGRWWLATFSSELLWNLQGLWMVHRHLLPRTRLLTGPHGVNPEARARENSAPLSHCVGCGSIAKTWCSSHRTGSRTVDSMTSTNGDWRTNIAIPAVTAD